mmetsp:Transcript_21017/g.83796  ORF Transcript_21017/g.83796 Transcript_21017/m.83796 type:complete len:293 (-) Transcript_21017:213-1091(-)
MALKMEDATSEVPDGAPPPPLEMRGRVEIAGVEGGDDVLTDPWGDYLVRYPIISSRLSWLVVDSGFLEYEDPEIHRLSLLLIRVVTLSFVVAVLFLWGSVAAAYALHAANMWFILKDAVFLTICHLVLFRASVQAVRTRNKPLCGCSALTWMGAFKWAYVVVALDASAALFYHLFIHPCDCALCAGQWATTIGLLTILVSTSICAELARRLRRVLPPTPGHFAPKARPGVAKRDHHRDNATVIVETETAASFSSEDRKMEDPYDAAERGPDDGSAPGRDTHHKVVPTGVRRP